MAVGWLLLTLHVTHLRMAPPPASRTTPPPPPPPLCMILLVASTGHHPKHVVNRHGAAGGVLCVYRRGCVDGMLNLVT